MTVWIWMWTQLKDTNTHLTLTDWTSLVEGFLQPVQYREIVQARDLASFVRFICHLEIFFHG